MHFSIEAIFVIGTRFKLYAPFLSRLTDQCHKTRNLITIELLQNCANNDALYAPDVFWCRVHADKQSQAEIR